MFTAIVLERQLQSWTTLRDSNLEAVVQGLEDYKIQENGSGAFVGIITKTDIVKAICGLKKIYYM